MENHLKSLGWNTIAIGYPSALIRIQSHADDLNRFLDRTQGFDNVIFVTHSMGGLVARAALARLAPWRQRIKVEGLIQLGTPNQGAGLARALRAFPVVGSLLGRTAVRSETRLIHRNHHQKFRFW
jgi:pimeloyl-ACP methyl ester carboxylesterase